jgi:hypothetical protein
MPGLGGPYQWRDAAEPVSVVPSGPSDEADALMNGRLRLDLARPDVVKQVAVRLR